MHGTITAVERQERRGGRRVNVYLDGSYAFSLSIDLSLGLRVGHVLSSEQVASLLERDQEHVSLDAALNYLGTRPRSEREIRRRLSRNPVPPSLLDRVVGRLRSLGLVDDHAFAQYWVEQRQTHRPRGARLLRAELRQKGVDSDLAAEIAESTEVTAAEDAYRAASKKAAQLKSLDERTFRTRLGQFLARRGFDWDTIAPTVERYWREAER